MGEKQANYSAKKYMAKLLEKGFLKVSKLHKIYYEVRGNKNGIPLVHILGGPGSKIKDRIRNLYPAKYKVLLFDQRGCGKSKPKDKLQENTTQHLVEDISNLMNHVGLKKAIISGGSWGSTLALCFAIQYPEKVKKLIVSGIYFGTKKENDRAFGYALKEFSPDIFAKLEEEYGKKESYTEILSKKTLQGSKRASEMLYLAEMSLMASDLPRKKQINKVFAHYMHNHCFIPDNFILKNAHKIKSPTTIIHGRQDVLCLPEHAYALSKKIKKSKLYLIPGGHFIPNFKKILRGHL